MKLVECVPNISEGRDQAVLDAVADAIRAVAGVELLDMDPGADTNRTVYTFVGSPEAAVEAAFQVIKRASELIDMSQHTGAHPRMGATDVCPFVPLTGTTMEDCAALAATLGARVGDELGIPVYLYESAAKRPERQNLAEVRAGEYEALASKAKDPFWAPDFGPAAFKPRAGATAIGAREFLVAYNINLNTRSVKAAKKIALQIREQGCNMRDAKGKFVRDENGVPKKAPGIFKHCKATGWFLDEHSLAQVTMNLTNFKETPVHEVFDKVCELATIEGLRVTGSEIVGLVPMEAMIAAGRHYLKKQKGFEGVSEDELVLTAIRSLGLRELSSFEPEQKIVEMRVRAARPLAALSVAGFLDELASDSPAPGGGSVAALAASLAAALTAMVPSLTHGKKGFKAVKAEMNEVAVTAQGLKDLYRDIIDRDTDAFNEVMAAFRLPKGSDEEKAARDAAVPEANKGATRVPLSLLRSVAEELPALVEAVIERGNPNSLSDAGVAALMARAGLEGAYLNVGINLEGMAEEKDAATMAFVKETSAAARALYAEGAPRFDELAGRVRGRILP